MIQLQVKFQDFAMRRKLTAALKHFKSFRPQMEKVGDWVIEDARKRLGQRRSKWPRGRLIKSLKRKAFKFAVNIFSHLPYARIQQEGGVVKSKRPGGMLAIPLREKEGRSHTWPKHWGKDRLFVLRSKGKVFLAAKMKQYTAIERKKRDGTIKKGRKHTGDAIELIYRLVPSVRIKGRPYLVKSPELIAYLRKLIVQKWENWRRGAA